MEVARKPRQVAYTHEAAEELERRLPPIATKSGIGRRPRRNGTRAFHGGFINYYDKGIYTR